MMLPKIIPSNSQEANRAFKIWPQLSNPSLPRALSASLPYPSGIHHTPSKGHNMNFIPWTEHDVQLNVIHLLYQTPVHPLWSLLRCSLLLQWGFSAFPHMCLAHIVCVAHNRVLFHSINIKQNLCSIFTTVPTVSPPNVLYFYSKLYTVVRINGCLWASNIKK